MKRATVTLIAALLLMSVISCRPVRIACVGDSITYGHGIADRENDTYAGVLNHRLGDRYDVRNFGISGRTLMNSGDSPYMSEQIYKDALAFQPNVVTIALGTNDSKPQNWAHQEDFKADLKELIGSFSGLPTKPEIWVCLPPPAYSHAWAINDSIICNAVIPYIKEVAKEVNVRIIDLNTPFISKQNLFLDTIHPNEEGHKVIASVISAYFRDSRKVRTKDTETSNK